MLKIAIVGTFQQCKQWVEHKYKNQIQQINAPQGKYTLNNWDELYLCYGDPSQYLSMEFDAFMVVPQYISPRTLEETIKQHCMRP